MKKIYFAVLIFSILFLSQPQQAQNYDQTFYRHTLSMRMFTLGYGAMPYKSATYDWTRAGGNMSYMLGFDYTYWFNRHIGISSGLELNYILSNEKLGAFSSQSKGIIKVYNGAGEQPVNATFRADVPGVEENQIYLMLEIPLMLSLQTKNLFCNVGAVMATSITSYSFFSYQPATYNIIHIDDFDNSFTFPIAAALDDSPAEGENEYTPADIKHPFFFMLGGEVGWKFSFNNRNMLSVSLYGRVALNSNKVDSYPLQTFAVDDARAETFPPLSAGLVDSFRYYTFGLGVTYHLGFGRPQAMGYSSLHGNSKSLL